MNPKPNSVFDENHVHSKSLSRYILYQGSCCSDHTKLLLRLSLELDTNKTMLNQGAYIKLLKKEMPIKITAQQKVP